MVSELRTANVAVQKISMPLESVPNRFVFDGGRSLGKVPHMVGSWGVKKERPANKKRMHTMVKLQLNR
jgi:hypothetical protein